ALVVKAENQAVLPTSPQLRSPVTNQLPLSIVTPSSRSSLQEQKLNSGISSPAEEKALVVKAENQAVLPTSPQLRSPVTNQLPLSIVTSPSTGSVPNTAIAGSALASARLLEELPLVKVENPAVLSASQALGHRTQPLVFARPAPTHVPSINKDLPTTASSHQSTERSPSVNAQPAAQRLSTPTVSPTQPPVVDVSYLTQQVERKLMRKLTVERERRGQRTWH
ncbi:hypothetical protein QUA42_18125, partial [Microcoleus sp. Pol11C2]|uniref:hypothetical protein n=1 Tax=Microcoleus sp. Pol11C2 TaxID=3055389 RepID=UPI002FD687D5